MHSIGVVKNGGRRPPTPSPSGREKQASISHHHQAAGAGLPAPDLAGRPGQLPDVGGRLVARKAVEAPGRGIEPHDGIGGPVGGPDLVGFVDIDPVTAGFALGQAEGLPAFGRRIVASDLAGVPKARPYVAFGIRPDPARADARSRRLPYSPPPPPPLALADDIPLQR